MVRFNPRTMRLRLKGTCDVIRRDAERLRTERGLSKYALEKSSGVPDANITQFESGARGIPTYRTVFDLAMGLGLNREESRHFLENALGERFLVELEEVRDLLLSSALVGDEEVERVTRVVREQMRNEPHIVEALTRRGVQGHERVLYDLLVAVAEMPELAHLRRQLAPAIIKTVTADLEFETVLLRPGATADDLLGSLGANPPKPRPYTGRIAAGSATRPLSESRLWKRRIA